MIASPNGLTITVLGTLEVLRAGEATPLPASRKTRALLGYLTLCERPQRREHLCDLFWQEGPDDPRGALRWSLSKLRAVIDGPARRLVADRETVSINQADIKVDLRTAAALPADASPAAMVEALTALRRPVLAGLDLSSHVSFQAWLTAERAAAERLRRTLLQRFAGSATMSAEDRLPWSREWLEADPLNAGAATMLQHTLLQMGRRAEAELAQRSFSAALGEAGLPRPAAPALPLSAVQPDGRADQDMLQRQKIHFCRAADGVRIAYASVGEGPPLVKAANWLNHLELDWDAPIWAPMFRELARDHTFFRYDERGNGLSEGRVEDISFNAFVCDLETVVDAAAIERFPLLGLSQGCAVAVEYAVRHPERVSHLVLWGGYAAGWRVDASLDVHAEREAIITLVRQGWGRTDTAYRQLFSATFMPGATAEELDWFNSFQRLTVTAEHAARFLEVFADIDVRDRLAQVRVPTLVMHARGDHRIPLAAGGELAAEIPGAEFVTLDSDNHLLLGREPASAAFVAHIRHFIGTGG